MDSNFDFSNDSNDFSLIEFDFVNDFPLIDLDFGDDYTELGGIIFTDFDTIM